MGRFSVGALIWTMLCLSVVANAQNGAPPLTINSARPSAPVLAAQQQADLKHAQEEVKKAEGALQQALDEARKAAVACVHTLGEDELKRALERLAFQQKQPIELLAETPKDVAKRLNAPTTAPALSPSGSRRRLGCG